MELWDGCTSIGSTDNNKILLIRQNHKTKLNENLRYYDSEVQMRNDLDLKFSELTEFRRNGFIDLNGYRYVIFYLPYFMIR